MENYEKQVEQEAAYPIPISLYNCYRTVRHEKRYIAIRNSYASPVTVVQRYRDGVCSLLFHLFFIINPRRACAARVTVVVLRESWGAFFSMKGGKGGERGGKGKRVKVQIEEGNSNS